MEGNTFVSVVGIVAGVCTSLSLLPQLIKIIREKKAEDISLFYLIILFSGLSIWTYYGFLRDDLPIIITNAVSLIINIFVLILSIRYKHKVN